MTEDRKAVEERKLEAAKMEEQRRTAEQRRQDRMMAESQEESERTKTYTARHRIIRTEAGQPRTYSAGQPIKLTDEEAKSLVEKKAVWASQEEADEAARAKIEGIMPAEPRQTAVDAPQEGDPNRDGHEQRQRRRGPEHDPKSIV